MDPIATAIAIGSAAMPLIQQLLQLFGLWGAAVEKKLTLPEVQAEIEKITKRQATDDAIYDAAAGYPVKP